MASSVIDVFLNACMNGDLEIVERLLLDPRVNPSTDDNQAIGMASDNGHLAVVERLLQDPRVDPSDYNNQAIRWASNNGHLAVVERLLLEERVDPSADDNYAIRWAIENGHHLVVERLMRDPRVSLTISTTDLVHLNNIHPISSYTPLTDEQKTSAITLTLNDSENSLCPISFEPLTLENIVVLSCLHCISKQAIIQWFSAGKSTCPLCRTVNQEPV